MSACFGAKVWKVADPWDTCLVPGDLASMMVGGGDCPHADSASVAVCASSLIREIINGDGDASNADDVSCVADTGKSIMRCSDDDDDDVCLCIATSVLLDADTHG